MKTCVVYDNLTLSTRYTNGFDLFSRAIVLVHSLTEPIYKGEEAEPNTVIAISVQLKEKAGLIVFLILSNKRKFKVAEKGRYHSMKL